MKKLIIFIKTHRKLLIIPAVILMMLVAYKTAHASLWQIGLEDLRLWIISLISDLTVVVTNLLGKLIGFFVYFLVDVASYNRFASAPAITKGWVLMRDLANMGIVIGLLIIAFGNVFFPQKYQLNKSLATLVIIAIVVNFSKTITLLLVDISQVVMLTFVNSFRNVGAGNLADVLGIERFFDVSANNPGVTVVSALAAMLFTMIIMILVLATIIILTATLMIRIIAIWFIIVLSPIAFMAYAIPVSKIQTIKDEWWKEFTNWLVIGPMLAFFIWLTFVSLQGASNFKDSSPVPKEQAQLQLRKEQTASTEQLGALASYDQLAGFVIAIGMLLMGLRFSAQVSGSAGKLAGQLSASAEGKLKSAALAPARAVGKTALEYGAAARRGAASRLYESKAIPTVGKLLTKRGREEYVQRGAARIEKRVGGKASAGVYEDTLTKQAEERKKDIKRMQLDQNKGDLKKYILDSAQSGDALSARAAVEMASEKGWLDQATGEKVMPQIKKTFLNEKSQTQFALDMEKKNREKGNIVSLTDKSIDDAGNVIPSEKSHGKQIEEQMKQLNRDEMVKLMDRPDALDQPFAQNRVTGLAKNGIQHIGSLTPEARNRMKVKMEELAQQEDFAASMSADQKQDFDKVYEAFSADYDNEGRRKENEETYTEEIKDASGKVVQTVEKKRTVKSKGKQMFGTMKNADVSDIATNKYLDMVAQKEAAGMSTADAYAEADQVYGTADGPLYNANIPTGDTLSGLYDQIPHTSAQAAIRKSVGGAATAAKDLAGDIKYELARQFSNFNNFNFGNKDVMRAEESRIESLPEQRLVVDKAEEVQKHIDDDRYDDNAINELNQMADAVMVSLGDERLEQSSGQKDPKNKNRSLTNREAIGYNFEEARKAMERARDKQSQLDAAKATGAPPDDISRLENENDRAKDEARKLAQKITLNATPNRAIRMRGKEAESLKGSHYRENLKSTRTRLEKSKGTQNESVVQNAVENLRNFMQRDLGGYLRSNRANVNVTNDVYTKFEMIRDQLTTDVDMAIDDKIELLNNYLKQVDRLIEEGTFFKLEREEQVGRDVIK